MFTHPDNHPPVKSHKQSAEAVGRVLTRFPLILDILGQLGNAQIPFPGDEDIRHGCERALTAMLVELARIQPAAPGKPTQIVEPTLKLLHSKTAARLINADQLQRIDQLVERILGTHQHHQ